VIFSFDGVGDLLMLPFVQNAFLASALLGLVAGALAPLIVARGMGFAVHGTAELAFTGGAAALLAGISVSVGAVVGAVIAGLVFGLLGLRQRERDSVIGVVLAFGLGLGVLLLALYDGRAANKFGLLTGSIVSVDSGNITVLVGVTVVVLAVLAVIYRPLLFASADPDVAVARGVPVRLLSPLFAVLVALTTALAVLAVIYRPLLFASADPDVAVARGVPVRLLSPLFAVLVALTTALAVPIVGAILVLSVTIIPGAAAARVTASPVKATVLAIGIAELALLGGTLLSLAPGLPISGYVATLAFLAYLACRLVGRTRGAVRTS
jgi:zinc/manganese transport system permease protein